MGFRNLIDDLSDDELRERLERWTLDTDLIERWMDNRDDEDTAHEIAVALGRWDD